MAITRRAVIDIGTNSVKLLVAEVVDGQVFPLVERSKQTRLGRGLYDAGCLTPEALAKTAEAVARFADLARPIVGSAIRVFATSAAREARNTDELLRAVRDAAGLPVEIISGQTEAEWVYRGVTTDPRLKGQRLLILDVGGGSTELVLGNGGHYTFQHSVALGSVRLLAQFHPSDPPKPEEWAACRAWLEAFVRREVAPPLQEHLHAPPPQPTQLVGTGGTSTILARMEWKMVGFDRRRLEGTRLSRRRIHEMRQQLWSLPLEPRRQLPGLPPNRADVILMGVAIYAAIMDGLGFEDLYVSTRGLRFGALLAEPRET